MQKPALTHTFLEETVQRMTRNRAATALLEGRDEAWPLEEVIFRKLGLRDTRAFTDPADTALAPMYDKDKPLHVPRCIASVTAEHDLYSTGTVNQLNGFGHGAAVKAIVRIVKSADKPAAR